MSTPPHDREQGPPSHGAPPGGQPHPQNLQPPVYGAPPVASAPSAPQPATPAPPVAQVAAPIEAPMQTGVRAPIPAAPDATEPSGGNVDAHVLGGRREVGERLSATVSSAASAESSIAKRRAKARALDREKQRAQGAAKEETKLESRVDEKSLRAPLDPPVHAGASSWSGIHIGQVLTWQAAIAAALAVHRQSVAVMVPVLVVCAVATILTVVRRKGRWLYEWLGIAIRYLLRRRTHPVSQADPHSVLRAASARASTSRLDVDGVNAGLVISPDGYSVAIDPTIDERTFVSSGMPQFPTLNELLPGIDASESAMTIQHLTLVLPAPSALNREDAAARSYASIGDGNIPARIRTWIVAHASVTPDTQGIPEIRAALVNAVRRLDRRLTKAGFVPRLVTDQHLARDLMTLLGTRSGGGREQRAIESWAHWRVEESYGATYSVEGWPVNSAAAYPRLIADIQRIPTASTVIALSAQREGEYVDVQCTIRVTDPDTESLARTDYELRKLTESIGIDLHRLDGEHAHGTYATLPTGGFAT